MDKLDDTRHCPMCEDSGKRIAYLESYIEAQKESFDEIAQANIKFQATVIELDQRVKVLTDALRIIMDDQHAEENRYVFLTAKNALFPPLPNESNSPETDLDEALRRQ